MPHFQKISGTLSKNAFGSRLQIVDHLIGAGTHDNPHFNYGRFNKVLEVFEGHDDSQEFCHSERSEESLLLLTIACLEDILLLVTTIVSNSYC